MGSTSQRHISYFPFYSSVSSLLLPLLFLPQPKLPSLSAPASPPKLDHRRLLFPHAAPHTIAPALEPARAHGRREALVFPKFGGSVTRVDPPDHSLQRPVVALGSTAAPL